MGTERWTAVVGFEGCYEVSTLGRVRSLRRRARRTTPTASVTTRGRIGSRTSISEKRENASVVYWSRLGCGDQQTLACGV